MVQGKGLDEKGLKAVLHSSECRMDWVRTRGLGFRRGPLSPSWEIIKISAPSEDDKNSTAEYAEAAELFLGKDKKSKSFYGNGFLFVFRSPGTQDQRTNEEEAENAEIIP
ncbi:MAG: hypothetical protein AMJ94_09030 [Deltaproteobacteria bacterium SM23_61]|nr:MAG: hypothetical protein AMJ94_09030 [Deltaproteobacteria bacterium SM23_61]